MKKRKFQDPADTLRHVLPDIEELDEGRGENRAEIYREAIAHLENYETNMCLLQELKTEIESLLKSIKDGHFLKEGKYDL